MNSVKTILWAVIAAAVIITGWTYFQNNTEPNKPKKAEPTKLIKTEPNKLIKTEPAKLKKTAVKVSPKIKPSIYAKPSAITKNPLYNSDKLAMEQVEREENTLDLSTPTPPTAFNKDEGTEISVAPTVSGLESREPRIQGLSIKLKGTF
jgi:hypothetical protein